MKKLFKNQVAVAIIIGALILALGIVAYALISKGNSGSKSVLDSVMNQDKIYQGSEFKDEEYILGSTKNDITLVVFSDFECPYCKKLHEEALGDIIEKYSTSEKDFSKGKIGIVYKLLPYQQGSAEEISASMCVKDLYGHSAYVHMVKEIFDKVEYSGNLDLSTLPNLAKEAIESAREDGQSVKKDFDSAEFTSCYESEANHAALTANVEDAIASGVEGTPHSLILYREDGEQIIVGRVSGAREASSFESIIDKLLKVK